MVNCTYCKKEIDRKVFCCASHKVLFHRLKTLARPYPDSLPKVNNVTDNLPKVNTVKEVKAVVAKLPPLQGFKACKHGGVKELCKLCITGH